MPKFDSFTVIKGARNELCCGTKSTPVYPPEDIIRADLQSSDPMDIFMGEIMTVRGCNSYDEETGICRRTRADCPFYPVIKPSEARLLTKK